MDDTLRLECIRSRDESKELFDRISGRPPGVYKSNGVTIEAAIFPDDAAASSLDVSNLTGLKLLGTDAAGPTAIFLKEVAIGAIVASITRADWEAGIAKQVTFELAGADTNVEIPASGPKRLILTLYGIDATSGEERTLGTGTLEIFEDYTGNAVGPPPGPGTGVTAAEVIAQIKSQIGVMLPFEIENGSLTGVVAYGETFGSIPTVYGVVSAQFDDEDDREDVLIDPDDVAADQLTVQVKVGGHDESIRGFVLVKPPA